VTVVKMTGDKVTVRQNDQMTGDKVTTDKMTGGQSDRGTKRLGTE
jgi:lipopolysaccharide export system protein LptA